MRVHAGTDAARSADAIHAAAYTAGSHVVFGANQYAPARRAGHRLLAHELGHVVQQSDAPIVNDLTIEKDPATVAPLHRERASVMRADRDAVRQIHKLENVVGAGIHFFPETLVDTQIGPVETRSAGSGRLGVIIGEGLSPRILARQILPLWTTATPFTPPGGGPKVEPGELTEEQLALALLRFNDTYLGLPNMTKWRVGLRVPLPVDLDAAGIGTLNPDQIRAMAASVEPAWMDLLDHRATTNVALPAPLLAEEARLFLADHPSAFARGLAVTIRATTNAPASHALIAEVFKQLTPVAGLEVAIEAIENMAPREMELLANQTAGGFILDALDDAISKPKPIPVQFHDRQAGARARLDVFPGHMLNDPPSKVPDRTEKTVTVDTLKVGSSKWNPATQVQVANALYAQCNVRIVHGVNKDAPPAYLGNDNALQTSRSCATPSAEERKLYDEGRSLFGLSARIQAYLVPDLKGTAAAAYSYPSDCSPGKYLGVAVISDHADQSTLAHEIGHILLVGPHKTDTLMADRRKQKGPRPNELDEAQCRQIYRNA